jgi:aminoglycoside N3'-acetyltransferase
MQIKEIVESIEPGSLLIVHASFKASRDEGVSPEQMIQMLMERLTPEGTLMMPTFTYHYSGIGFPPYDPATSPGVLNGVLSETFRQMPGVLRSENPTYSVAAWGKHADLLARKALPWAGLGHKSSYEYAYQNGAKILLFNVRNNRNSMLHYAEVAAGLPYNDIPFRECWGRRANTIKGEMTLVEEFPACSEEFLKFDELFLKEGIARQLGNSMLLDSVKMVDYVIKKMQETPDIMLCHHFSCEPCILRRRRLRERGLI